MARRTVVLTAAPSRKRGAEPCVELKVRDWAAEGLGPVLLGWTIGRESSNAEKELAMLVAKSASAEAAELVTNCNALAK